MPETIPQNDCKSISEMVDLLNKYLPLHVPICHIKDKASRKPYEARRLVVDYIRLELPVIYNPSMPVSAHGVVLVPTTLETSGISLNPVLREDGKIYRMQVEVVRDCIKVSAPVYTRYDEHFLGNHCVGYDCHAFVVPTRE